MYPTLIVVLAAGLLAARQRMHHAEDELARLSVELDNARQAARSPLGAMVTQRPETVAASVGSAEFASEWEQAVPPMDS